ncbi:unnamed protein product [Prunus armeniaca]
MTIAIRSAIGKLGSKYSSRCHSKGRIVANMVRVGDFQIRSAVVNNYNIDRDVLFSTSKPPSSYSYSSHHPFPFGNHHKKPPPVLHLQYVEVFRMEVYLEEKSMENVAEKRERRCEREREFVTQLQSLECTHSHTDFILT